MKKWIVYSLIVSQIIFILLVPVLIDLTNYLHPLVIGVVWLLLTTVVFISGRIVFNERIMIPGWIVHFLLFIYTIGLLVLLFFRPEAQSYGTINLHPFKTIDFYLSGHVKGIIALYNIGANIGLFIPFGLYYHYRLKTPSWKKLLFIGVCSIISIEITQFFTKRGSLDIDDFILNVLGILLGYIIAPSIKRMIVVKGI